MEPAVDALHAPHATGLATVFALGLVVVALALYLMGVVSRQRAGQHWSAWRSASFVSGIALLAIAVLPATVEWAHRDLSGHMVQHLLLGMFAPLGLVLGAPGSLLLCSVPPHFARRVTALCAARVVRTLIHPVTAFILDIGAMYVLYLTSLYARMLETPALHAFVHLHFLVAGYLFTWAIAGPDPAPHRPGMLVRAAVLLIATAAHASLAKLMYAYGFPRGGGHSAEEIQAAAQWMYYGGDLAELLLAIAFFATWFGMRRRRYLHTPGPSVGAAGAS